MTGQAAWYDLRVNIEKAEAGDAVSEPAFKHQSQVGCGGWPTAICAMVRNGINSVRIQGFWNTRIRTR